jgi:hypothetical protein
MDANGQEQLSPIRVHSRFIFGKRNQALWFNWALKGEVCFVVNFPNSKGLPQLGIGLV